MKHIVILGASYGGVSIAHRILKQAGKTEEPFKITLVSPNTDFYWSMASPRAFVPGQFDEAKLFQPIAKGFSQYPASKFEFIIGSAESLDVDAKKVQISTSTTSRTLEYDFLVLATGSSAHGNIPSKGLGSTEATKEALHKTQAQIKAANTIVVAGAQATGVEIAGEIAFEYKGNKEIILIADKSILLPQATPHVSQFALRELQKLGVIIKFSTRVVSTVLLANNQTELTLSSGDTLVTDMYIPAYGATPNSAYLPARYLDTHKQVVVDDRLRVEGKSVWAMGDVSACESNQALYLESQSVYVAKSVINALAGKETLPYKASDRPVMGVQIGRSTAAGHFGTWKIPSFLVTYMRKNLFTERLQGTVDGSGY